jgi:hypothetical protein
MAWNPSPKVADCRDIAKKWGHKQIIIIAMNDDTGRIEMATYGETKELCTETKRLGDAAYSAVLGAYQ